MPRCLGVVGVCAKGRAASLHFTFSAAVGAGLAAAVFRTTAASSVASGTRSPSFHVRVIVRDALGFLDGAPQTLLLGRESFNYCPLRKGRKGASHSWPRPAERRGDNANDLDIEPATGSVPSLPGNVLSTRSDGLLIGYKVARQFESHPLRQPVHTFCYILEKAETLRGNVAFLPAIAHRREPIHAGFARFGEHSLCAK
jgi:hypothetical protein